MRNLVLVPLIMLGVVACRGPGVSGPCSADADWWISDVRLSPASLMAGSGESLTIEIDVEDSDYLRFENRLVIWLASERGYVAANPNTPGEPPSYLDPSWSTNTRLDGPRGTWTLMGPSFVDVSVPPGNYFLVVEDTLHVCPRAYFLPVVMGAP